MRITGGQYRSRVVKMPPGILRPAMDRMRESMFGVLTSATGGSLEGRSFLDLFSGSGIVALEAASRGANPVVLVEKDTQKGKVMRQNMGIASNQKLSLYLMSVEQFMARCKDKFHYIHLDPPFPLEGKTALMEQLDKADLLADGGIITIHYPREDRLPEHIGGLKRYDLRTYGRSYLGFYRRLASPS
jgi:16S rRNA (guanine966-N2)-methyltransferase